MFAYFDQGLMYCGQNGTALLVGSKGDVRTVILMKYKQSLQGKMDCLRKIQRKRQRQKYLN